MREMVISNPALGDRDALDTIWRKHGYWFFRDVLNKEALMAMREEYMRELKALDLIASDASEPLWNGRAIENFPNKFETLHERRVWQKFVKSPKIEAFFEGVLNDEIYWIPMDYYRLVPPNKTPNPDPNPMPIKRAEVVQALPPGLLVMASEEDGRARVLRPQN